MKNYDGIILFFFLIGVILALYFGMTTLVKKSFNTVPPPKPVISQKEHRKQRNRIRDIKQRQKEMMRAQKQRIRDLSR